MGTSWWMTASRRQVPRGRKIIRWNLLGLQDPALTSIEEVRQQIISTASNGLSPETLARASKRTVSPQAASRKAVSTQMQKEGISESETNTLTPKGKPSAKLKQQRGKP